MSLLRRKKTDLVDQLQKLTCKYTERSGGDVVNQKSSTLGRHASTRTADTQKLLNDISTLLTNLRRQIAIDDDIKTTKIFSSIESLAYSHQLFDTLFSLIDRLSVSARAAVVEIFAHLLRQTDEKFLRYIIQRCTLGHLVDYYTTAEPSSALSYGIAIRQCIEFAGPAKQLLYAGQRLWSVFSLAACTAFELASDAYVTLRDLFTRHEKLVGAYTDSQYEQLLEQFDRLLYLDNYFTTRQTLRLMSDMMLNPVNYTMMKRYVSCDSNLRCTMSLLVHKSSSIQMQAFHVFKIFIANPDQPKEIKHLLQINKQQLVDFMTIFQEANSDQEFINERTYVLQRIQDI